jgi:hypothetical protein
VSRALYPSSNVERPRECGTTVGEQPAPLSPLQLLPTSLPITVETIFDEPAVEKVSLPSSATIIEMFPTDSVIKDTPAPLIPPEPPPDPFLLRCCTASVHLPDHPSMFKQQSRSARVKRNTSLPVTQEKWHCIFAQFYGNCMFDNISPPLFMRTIAVVYSCPALHSQQNKLATWIISLVV